MRGYTKYSRAEPPKSRCQMFVIKTPKRSVLSVQFSLAQRRRGAEERDKPESLVMPDTTYQNQITNADGYKRYELQFEGKYLCQRGARCPLKCITQLNSLFQSHRGGRQEITEGSGISFLTFWSGLPYGKHTVLPPYTLF